MKKFWAKFNKVILAAGAVIVVIIVVLIVGANKHTDGGADPTPSTNAKPSTGLSTAVGYLVFAEDLVNVNGDADLRIVEAVWKSGGSEGLVVSDDGSTLSVVSGTGDAIVKVNVKGKSADAGKETTVEVSLKVLEKKP